MASHQKNKPVIPARGNVILDKGRGKARVNQGDGKLDPDRITDLIGRGPLKDRVNAAKVLPIRGAARARHPVHDFPQGFDAHKPVQDDEARRIGNPIKPFQQRVNAVMNDGNLRGNAPLAGVRPGLDAVQGMPNQFKGFDVADRNSRKGIVEFGKAVPTPKEKNPPPIGWESWEQYTEANKKVTERIAHEYYLKKENERKELQRLQRQWVNEARDTGERVRRQCQVQAKPEMVPPSSMPVPDPARLHFPLVSAQPHHQNWFHVSDFNVTPEADSTSRLPPRPSPPGPSTRQPRASGETHFHPRYENY